MCMKGQARQTCTEYSRHRMGWHAACEAGGLRMESECPEEMEDDLNVAMVMCTMPRQDWYKVH